MIEFKFTISDIISIISIVVNIYLAKTIAKEVADNSSNKRVLKDLMISEIRDIQNQSDLFKKELLEGKLNSRDIQYWFKINNIRIRDVSKILHEKFDISKDLLEPYKNEMRELVTNSECFISDYNKNSVQFDEEFKKELLEFYKKNNNVFIKILVDINDK